jgi:hypothetical protein
MRHRRQKKQRWHCLDCGVDTIKSGHYYMVRNHVWAQSGCSPNGGMLCLYCLTRRLGRKLKPKDFICVYASVTAWRDYRNYRLVSKCRDQLNLPFGER